MSVAIIDTGVANLASVRRAFASLNMTSITTRDPGVVRDAPFVVLPGVGAFGSGMATLRQHGLDVAIRERVALGAPLLAVCLGMQLLADASEESPGIAGLGIVGGCCVRLPAHQTVPHLGWNSVRPRGRTRMLAPGYAAFANSYALTVAPEGWGMATTSYGGEFIAALEHGRVVACQFHPELSGDYGLDFLRRWLLDIDAPRSVAATENGFARRIIACLDVQDGRVVKGVRFSTLRDSGDPAARAALYEASGADEIVMLDIAASPAAQSTQLQTVRAIRQAIAIPFTVGGGVRSIEDAERLLDAGADRVAINSAACADPDLIHRVHARFGAQCTVVAIDARRGTDGWEVLTHGGRRPSGRGVTAWAREAAERGAGEILLTSWDRDGTRAGADLELLAAIRGAVRLPIVASGGIGSIAHAADAFAAGADAVLAASIFHDNLLGVAALKDGLRARGMVMRRSLEAA